MKILIIDAYNMIHRSRFGFAQGEHAITFTFFRSLKSEIVKHEADKVFIVSEGVPFHRLAINSDYKGQRKPIQDDLFHKQKHEILNLCLHLPVTFIRHPNYECDDVIGFLCKNADLKDKVTIVSSDSDFIQLLDLDNVSLWNPIKKQFVDKWPVDYVTWKSLKGDPTDNVSGIKGVGEKRAFNLAENHTVLNNFLNEDPERRNIFEKAYKQILLADIDHTSSDWEIKNCLFDENHVFRAFTDYGFKSIIGNAWTSWKQTLENLNNVTTKCTAYK